jgi:outer membrane receptor for ferrienterochelin and colicin
MGNSAVRTDDVDFQLGVGYYTREASLEMSPDTDGVKDIGPYRNNNEAIFARLSNTFLSGPLSGVTLGFMYMDRKNGYGSSWNLISNPANTHRFWSAIPYAKHQVAFSEKVKLESYAKANVSTEIGRQIMTDGWVNGSMHMNTYYNTIIRQNSDATWDTTTTPSESFLNYTQNHTIIIDQNGDTISVRDQYTDRLDTTAVRNSFHFDVQSNNIELYSKLSYDITPDIGVLFGANYDVRWQDGTRAWTQLADVSAKADMVSKLYDKKAHTFSVFAQGRGEVPLLNGLILTLGGRLDNGYLDKNAFHQFSPRAAGILRVTENLTTKLMYATALQAPGAGEVSHNKEKQRDWLDKEYNKVHPDAPLIIPDLKAEGTKNTELNITYTAQKFMAGVTGFYNVITNRMERTKPAAWYQLDPNLPDIVWNMDDKSKALGVEIETQFAPTQDLRLRLNGSYTETDNGDSNATAVEGIPLAQTNASVQYRFPFGLSAFLSVNGIWKIVTNTNEQSVAQTEFGTEEYWMKALRPKTYLRDGYALVDLTLSQTVGKNASVDLTISNLTNAQYTYVGLMAPAPNINARLGIATKF